MPRYNNRVYLDHLIKRDSLLYKSSVQAGTTTDKQRERDYLEIESLSREEKGRAHMRWLLRKPDFQRATWAWTPEECVELLEAVLKEQVVPSVILWQSPDNLMYVLDGGHRISVIIAWITDDWGDGPEVGKNDESLRQFAREAAVEVRKLLVSKKIGSFLDWQKASSRYQEIMERNDEPELLMEHTELDYAKRYNSWSSNKIGFPILWVRGDYETAERSFLKINKAGRRLTEWETKLVENRTSSFARIVMSLANIDHAAHCWPSKDPENLSTSNVFREKVEGILSKIHTLHDLLFLPTYKTPIESPKMPLMGINDSYQELRPAYTGELLTVISGKKGKKTEMETLLKAGRFTSANNIVNRGIDIIDDAIDAISNIQGASPRSLGLAPLVYYYNSSGLWVRSMLYGMLYWISYGNDSADVFQRKLILTIHRREFEKVLLDNKDKIIRRISRRIGSGPEVTLQYARYYQGLLTFLIIYEGKISEEAFINAHEELIESVGSSRNGVVQIIESVSTSRVYEGLSAQAVHVREHLGVMPQCEICGGRYYPGQFTQIDHILPHSKGGKTSPANGRNTHPFCNNNRDRIENLQNGNEVIKLPNFELPLPSTENQQLNFLSFLDFGPALDDPEIVEEESDEIDSTADES